MNLEVTYSVNGLIGPMTDVVEVPDNYNMSDVRIALTTLLVEVGAAMNQRLTLRNILFARPPR